MQSQSDDPERAAVWQLVLAARRPQSSAPGCVLAVGDDLKVTPNIGEDAIAAIRFDKGVWNTVLAPPDRELLSLYLPVCHVSTESAFVVAHLGQSLDGCIATASGDSYYVTGPENLDHLHRMRALCDAVVVGAGTVEADDPQLTTRRVPGPSPVRVVIDPDGRLPPTRRVFECSGAHTIVVRARRRRTDRSRTSIALQADVIELDRDERGLGSAALIEALAERGLTSVFVEGGGRTVSTMLQDGVLDRLQIAVAPLILGRGRPGLDLPGRAAIRDCIRPDSRLFRMGNDVLFDCDLRRAG